jgi:hypothetical protein
MTHISGMQKTILTWEAETGEAAGQGCGNHGSRFRHGQEMAKLFAA